MLQAVHGAAKKLVVVLIGMSPGTQCQDTSSYKTRRLVCLV